MQMKIWDHVHGRHVRALNLGLHQLQKVPSGVISTNSEDFTKRYGTGKGL